MKSASKIRVSFLIDLTPIILLLLYGTCLYGLACHIPREDFGSLLLFFSVGYSLSLVFFFGFKSFNFSFKSILVAAVCLRLLFLISIPQLSDDYFRYFFDGHLLSNGISPYSFTPETAKDMLPADREDLWEALFEGMNSKTYHTIYPPLHQGVFFLATCWASSIMDSIVFLRILLILFDLVNIFLLRKILLGNGEGIKGIALYAFSPLVILESVGNLHFEGIVLTCLLSTIFFVQRTDVGRAALSWSLAVGIKLVPVIFAPLWVFYLSGRPFVRFVSVACMALVVFFFPLLNITAFGNFIESFLLFQRKFEFNASLYYVVREVSMWFVPFNPIAYVVPALGTVALVLILMISLRTKANDPRALHRAMVWIYMAYLLLQPVVHPWYIIPVLGLGILACEWLPIVWSGLIFLSYSAYQTSPVEEQPVFLWLQYGPLYGYMAYRFLYRARPLRTVT
jgi:Gpi18-like mannosyltransferase